MIDKQEAAIFKLKQDFNRIKRKFLNTSNVQKTGKSYQLYVLILQWHVMYFLL